MNEALKIDDKLYYLPMQRSIVKVTENGSALFGEYEKDIFVHQWINEYFTEHKSIESQIPIRGFLPTSAYLLISDACNCQCRYCYSNAGVRGEKMPFKTCKIVIDFLIRNALIGKVSGKKEPKVQIRYMGGGEPTLNWSVLVQSYEYAHNLCDKYGVKLDVGLQTNGQVISEKKLDWIIKNIDSLGVSMDGMANIQNYQRPRLNGNSFESVKTFLTYVSNHKKKCTVRATVSNKSIYEMQEFIMWLDQINIKFFHVEPLSVCGRAINNELKPPNPYDYVNHYLLWKKSFRENNIDIICSLDVIWSRINKSLCSGYLGGALFVNPKGELSCCTEVTSSVDEDFTSYKMGQCDLTNNKVILNKKPLNIKQIYVNKQCMQCFLKYSCDMCIRRYQRDQKVDNDYNCIIKKNIAQANILAFCQNTDDNKSTQNCYLEEIVSVN